MIWTVATYVQQMYCQKSVAHVFLSLELWWTSGDVKWNQDTKKIKQLWNRELKFEAMLTDSNSAHDNTK